MNPPKKLTFFFFFLLLSCYALLVHCSIAPFTEAVKVNIEFINPLQITIPVSGVTLICKHSTSTDELTSGKLRVSANAFYPFLLLYSFFCIY